jgi:hypothetical protein
MGHSQTSLTRPTRSGFPRKADIGTNGFMSTRPNVLVTIVVLTICAYFGFLRPTGLAGRTRKEDEEDRRRDLTTKWLNKHDERS